MILVGQKRPVLDFEDHLLSTGWWLRHPSENMSSSVGVTIPNIWEIKKQCSKPPTAFKYRLEITSYYISEIVRWEHLPQFSMTQNCLIGCANLGNPMAHKSPISGDGRVES